MANISFTVTRGGTAYLTTLLERLEIRKSNNDKSELVTNFQNKTWSPARYSTFDYLQDEKPTGGFLTAERLVRCRVVLCRRRRERRARPGRE